MNVLGYRVTVWMETYRKFGDEDMVKIIDMSMKSCLKIFGY